MRAPIRVVLFTLVLLELRGAAAEAQHGAQTLVRVRVVDTTGAAVANADVTLLRGLTTVATSGATDDAGQRTLTIPRDGEYQIVVRRIGFQRADQFFHADRDSIVLRMVLHRSTQQLPTVSVTADQDLRRKHYHVDADEIAASKRPIIDGLDILTKLRPDIIYPRVPPRSLDACGLFYVWVNGKRIVFAPVNEALAMKAAQERRAARATPHMGITGLAAVPVNVQSVLSSIHPEHIAEINYADCNDFSVERTNARNAVFVTLKPGIGFEPGRGSFVADEPVRATDLLAQSASVRDSIQITLTMAKPKLR